MRRIVALMLGIVLCLSAMAADNTQYVKLTKGMVINYGEPSANRLKYLKVAVDVRVKSADAADLVEYHQPALLDALVMLFTSTEDMMVKTVDGKEAIRQQALDQVRNVMLAEVGDQVVEDLLFSSFVVQR